MVGAGGPDKNRHRLSVFGYDLNERVAHGPEVPQEVFSVEPLCNLLTVSRICRRSHYQIPAIANLSNIIKNFHPIGQCLKRS